MPIYGVSGWLFSVLFFNFRCFYVCSGVCVGETYSFAIFGGAVDLSELQMCMALSVGVFQMNYSEVAIFLFAVAIFLFAVAIIPFAGGLI